MSFVHLHTHTEYSPLDGAIRINDMVEKALEFKLPACAITDHGNMFGAVEFYKKVTKGGLKPIIGFEAYIAPLGRDSRKRDDFLPNYFHMTLLARNNEGYKNLMKLTTAGFLEGFYHKPRIDLDILSTHSAGITALSGCLNGELIFYLRNNREQEAYKKALAFQELFNNHFYLEIQNQGIDGQVELNDALIKMGKELNIPVVATNDCHYLTHKDSKAHEILLAIQTQTNMSDPNRFRFTGDNFYYKSPEEMKNLFKHVPEAIENTLRIAEDCHVEIEFGKYHIPTYKIPDQEITEQEYLKSLAEKGLEEKFRIISKAEGELSEEKKEVYRKRLVYELEVIQQMQFPGYFLIVRDYVNACKEMDIPVGPGRGSAAGSLLAYSIGITDIDPIKYDLFFERFLNPGRISMPDIDIDFCQDRREEVIRYMKERFGEKNTTQIITFSKLKAKMVVRDVGRALGYSFGEVDRVAKLIPDMTKNLKTAQEESADFAKAVKENPVAKDIMEYARSLEGLCRNFGVHAAGVIITPEECSNYIPLAQSKDMVTSQYPGDQLEGLGLLKMDILGLKTLTVIKNALEMVERNHGIKLDFQTISLEDPKTYEFLRTGKTSGVFQLESSGMQDILVRLRPESFSEIPDLLALYRPGPIQSGMVEDYIMAKKGKGSHKDYISDTIKPVLESTKGVIVYQEQIMQISRDLSGFSMSEADNLRKAMGKKDEQKMAEMKAKFVSGAVERGENEKMTSKLFDEIAKFAQYCFNKSHSVAYAYISFQTAYLKAHYPVEFMAALMNSEIGNKDKLVARFSDTREMGIEILPPDVNHSMSGFSTMGENILFGLSAIKSVGSAAVDHIIEVRNKKGHFKDFLSFCKRVNLSTANKRVIEHLIKSGAFDCLQQSRKALMFQMDEAVEYSERYKRDKAIGQGASLFGDGDIPTPKFDGMDIDEWKEREKLAKEKEALGFYISGHPLMEYREFIKKYANTDIANIQQKRNYSEVVFAGVVSELNKKINKRKESWAIARIEDLTGTAEVMVYSKVYAAAERLLNSDTPLLIKGKVEDDNPPDSGEEGVEAQETMKKIIASEVHELANAGGNVAVYIDIKTLGAEEDSLDTVEQLLKKYKGNTPVILNFIDPEGNKVSVATGKEHSVEPIENFFNEATEILGKFSARCDVTH